jgi:glycine dehydrogenase subunit 1
MSYVPHTEAEKHRMLDALGLQSIDDLFDAIPADLQFRQRLDIPPPMPELELRRHAGELAGRNEDVSCRPCFLGAGIYDHYVPSVVGTVVGRGEFYTAYTPYQPEVSQGTLQVIYEFQSLVAALTGMDVANASMYDGATALAEGALMTVSIPRGRRRIVVSPTVHPAYRDVLRTYLEGLDLDLVEVPLENPGFMTSPDEIAPYLTDDLACVVVQYPNFFGGIEEIAAFADLAHARGGALVVSTYPVPLGLLQPPGELGADIVAAEGQALGVPQGYGGPYVGLLASRQSYVRQMPGRLAGMTTDSEDKRGFVLTLQTREQHIRREKATSNICTNQGLMATAATVYMATLGPEGFREVARRSYQNAHYLAERISGVPGYALATEGPFFHEFVISTPGPASDVLAGLLEQGIFGGLDLAKIDPSLDRYLLMCATETNTKQGIDRLVDALPR